VLHEKKWQDDIASEHDKGGEVGTGSLAEPASRHGTEQPADENGGDDLDGFQRRRD
jgi:hypothetical protein